MHSLLLSAPNPVPTCCLCQQPSRIVQTSGQLSQKHISILLQLILPSLEPVLIKSNHHFEFTLCAVHRKWIIQRLVADLTISPVLIWVTIPHQFQFMPNLPKHHCLQPNLVPMPIPERYWFTLAPNVGPKPKGVGVFKGTAWWFRSPIPRKHFVYSN